MEQQLDKITINGMSYVREGAAPKLAETYNGMPYVIVRTYSSGVFAGFLKERTGQEAIVLQARRLWYWDGAASLSQLAVDGVSKPKNCKFPAAVDKIELMQVIEILTCTEAAQKSIAGVKTWKV